MPTPTDVLNEDIRDLKAANLRVADRMDRLADEIHDFRLTLQSELGTIRADVRELQASTRVALKLAAWVVGIVTPVIITLVGLAIAGAWYASKLDSRVGQLEQPKAAASPK